jgi:hypothetical protein
MTPRQKGKRQMRFEHIHGSKVIPPKEATAFMIAVSERRNARLLLARKDRIEKRYAHVPERRSVEIAKLAVEEQIVKALWTIARQPLGKVAPLEAKRCGLEYMHDRTDIHSIYADAAGGKYHSEAPTPAAPSAREISLADQVQAWMLLIDDEALRRLLLAGAGYKRGDAGRRIAWIRIQPSLPEWKGYTVRTLQRQYEESLRIIADALAIARMAQ